MVVDAFTLSWEKITFYAFPPFSIITNVVQKVVADKASGVLITPDWPGQVWYPALKRLALLPPVRLPCQKALLHLPSLPEEIHPLIQRRKLHLLAWKISGNN